MRNHKLDENEIKDIAHFLTRRSLTTETGRPGTALAEYLETYNSLVDKLEEYNKTTN